MGRILRAAREAKGLTQVELSKETSVAARTIMDIENDKRYPTYEVFYRLIRTLEISADHVFWPDKLTHTTEHEQLYRALQSCSQQEQAIFMKIAWAYVQAVKSEKNAIKKADD